MTSAARCSWKEREVRDTWDHKVEQDKTRNSVCESWTSMELRPVLFFIDMSSKLPVLDVNLHRRKVKEAGEKKLIENL